MVLGCAMDFSRFLWPFQRIKNEHGNKKEKKKKGKKVKKTRESIQTEVLLAGQEEDEQTFLPLQKPVDICIRSGAL